MSSKEALIGALITPKFRELQQKLKFWGYGIDMPEDKDWTSPDALTLEKFLTMNPTPTSSSSTEVTLYGIAWEFVWGEKPPEIVTKARQELVRKVIRGEELEPIESLWLKLITVDTDSF